MWAQFFLGPHRILISPFILFVCYSYQTREQFPPNHLEEILGENTFQPQD